MQTQIWKNINITLIKCMGLTIKKNWRRKFEQSNIQVISFIVVIFIEHDLLHQVRQR